MTGEILTVRLNRNGNFREVAAKLYEGEAYALTYANRTQANRKATDLGDGWEVIRGGRPFYVARK